MKEQFEDDLDEMRETGKIYQLVGERFGDRVNVTFVDPRNILTIMSFMFRHLMKREIGIGAMLKNTFWGSRRGAMFLNGHWINQNTQTDEEIINTLQQELGVDE
ncbi:hypothetical protein [Pseudalkalibacillus sp. SCS-8]|uniref:hypothetical protein n=1 Tax=Pseudalkalibacillus nanhaiensis TaxID=3115291 RepID=UPI0032DA28B3